jgi:hypothetical protein
MGLIMQDTFVSIGFWVLSVVFFESRIVNAKILIQTNKGTTYIYLLTIFYIYIKIKNVTPSWGQDRCLSTGRRVKRLLSWDRQVKAILNLARRVLILF